MCVMLYPRRPTIGLQLRRKPDSNPELNLLTANLPPGAEPEWPILNDFSNRYLVICQLIFI